MTSGQIFRHNSRLTYGLTSSLPEKDVVSADWLLRVLPDFGIVQLDGRRTSSVVTQFELLIDIPLVRWNSTKQFASYAALLADVLAFPSAEHVCLQHSLRVWAEKGGVLWVLVEGDDIPTEQLISLLRYRPLSRTGQFAIRILLKVADEKKNSPSFAVLADVIHERVGDLLPIKQKPCKAYASYLFIFFLSAASIAATLYVASEEKSALAKAAATNKISSPLVMSEHPSVETRLSAQTPSAVTPPDSPIDSLSLSEKTEVVAFIEQWSGAWQEQSIDEYFSMYSDGYSAYQHMSSNEWRIWRTVRLEKPVWISIEIGPVTVERRTGGESESEWKEEFRATFWQLYRSPDYQDDTLKTLILRREAGGLKITDEINEEVRPLSQE